MKNNEMQKIHEIAFKILCEIDRICEKNDIKYFLSSGTLLGAVRHQNFIPWDDDADIAMTREEYNKFAEACRDELGDDFEFLSCDQSGNHFVDFIPGVVYRKCRWFDEQEEQKDAYNYVKTDIFILEQSYNQRWREKVRVAHMLMIYGLAMGHRTDIQWRKFSGVTKIAIRFFSKLGEKIPLKKLREKYTRVSTKLQGKKTNRYLSNVPPPWLSLKLVHQYPVDWFSESVRLPLNGKEFPVPKDWDKLLELSYHNYMELPPEEERRGKHINMNTFEMLE